MFIGWILIANQDEFLPAIRNDCCFFPHTSVLLPFQGTHSSLRALFVQDMSHAHQT